VGIAELSVPALFVAGLATSPHCALMCGPLQLAQLRRSGGSTQAAAWLHAGRVSGYTALGALAGAVGAQGLMWLPSTSVGAWIQIAAVLVLAGLGLNYLRRPSPACCVPAVRSASGGPVVLRHLARGWAWSLLPCAALYAMLLLAALSASAMHGALLMAAFGLGTVPLVAGSALTLQRRLGSAQTPRRVAALVLLLFAGVAALSIGFDGDSLWCRATAG
jgi:uncharacterized protein